MAVKSGKNTKAVLYFQCYLKNKIASSGKNQKEMAAILGISQSGLSDYIGGEKTPSIAQMKKIVEGLGDEIVDALIYGRDYLNGFKKKDIALLIDNNREIELLRKLEIANDELRALRLKVEDLERGEHIQRACTNARETALSVKTQDGLSTMEFREPSK